MIPFSIEQAPDINAGQENRNRRKQDAEEIVGDDERV